MRSAWGQNAASSTPNRLRAWPRAMSRMTGSKAYRVATVMPGFHECADLGKEVSAWRPEGSTARHGKAWGKRDAAFWVKRTSQRTIGAPSCHATASAFRAPPKSSRPS